MPAFVQITLNPDQAAGELRARLARLEDATPLMRQIGEQVLLSTDDNFVHERAPSGEAWAPLSPATYAAAFRKRYSKAKRTKRDGSSTAKYDRYQAGKKILQEKGTRGGLRGSITYRAGSTSVTIGSNKVYAAAHQFGLGARSVVGSRRRMPELPARPFVGVSEADRSVIADLIRRYVAESV